MAAPWTDLSRELALRLRPHLPHITAAVIEAIAQEVPNYARPLEGRFGEGVRRGAGVALERFLDLPGTSEPALREQDREVYAALGRGELLQGRELQTLLAAYRVGARVAFRVVTNLARAEGVPADELVLLGEAVFAYIDELSAASVEGYAEEQSLRAGETDRRRAQLLALLMSGNLDPPAAAEAARRAGWPLPETVVGLVVSPDRAEGLSVRLGHRALVGELDEHVVAVLPRPAQPDERAALATRLGGRRAVIGPARPWAAARTSVRLAALGAGLMQSGVVAGDPVFVDEHLATLLVHRDADLIGELVAARLAPLDAARESAGERLAETLLAWLEHRGERQRIAAALHVHPQTVGYRLNQLRALFGDALDDPQARFELQLALRARLPRRSERVRATAPHDAV